MGQKMYTCVALTVVALVSTMHFGVEAWGGLFNRFSPEMLSNLGYGSHGDHMSKSGLYQVWEKFFIITNEVFSNKTRYLHTSSNNCCNFAAVLPVYDRYIIFIELCAFHVHVYLQTIQYRGNIIKFLFDINYWLNLKNCFEHLICNKYTNQKDIYVISSIFCVI